MSSSRRPADEPGSTAGLGPATAVLARIVQGVRDGQLDGPTPCGDMTVGELLDHIDSLSVAFAAAATKTRRDDGGRAPVPDASRLGTDWRERIPDRLAELARAWRPATAWTGTTHIGGNDMPAEIAGAAAFNEVIVHGWDLATATGRLYPGDDPALGEALRTALSWVRSVAEQNPDGSPGLFGPPVAVPDDAPLLDRLLGLTGRRPS
ncbi:TIGR03086 family metal-binding protein [Sphaerisporangium fuscum]|uniref:TIGR03086 family metal-binding protein n=1 Tax=Sphaerisporangium fuscum TaxID=2835868 RepID=UPI001BDC39DE|nr:TIGR03086 family metal-binding protein [Sphaerisporangium fuscum]